MKNLVLMTGLACWAALAVTSAHAGTTSTASPAYLLADNDTQAAARQALQQQMDSSTPPAAVTNAVTVGTNTVETNTNLADVATNTTTTMVSEATNAIAVVPVVVAVTVTNPAPAPVIAVVAPVAVVTPAVAPTTPTVSSIPLIQFSDVPLTTAIENLARQANINYLLDPKISYGSPDASGQVKTEPTLSIRWENISAENALLALLDNYGLQLIRDPQTGIARISMKDPTAAPALTTQVLQIKYASVSNLVVAVTSALTDKRSKVLADVRTSQLVVVATEGEQRAVEALALSLDKPTKQVLIETKLVEISSNPTSQKGVDWTSTLQAQHVSFGNNSAFFTPPAAIAGKPTTIAPGYGGVQSGVLSTPGLLADTTQGFGPAAFLNADGLSVVLSFLNSSSDAQVVSTPRVVTLDNQMATISVVRGYPVFNVTAGTANTTGGSQVSYTNVGTVLNVTPRISANDQIELTVAPQVSTYAGVSTLTVAGTTYQADLFDFRNFSTDVLIPNAHTLVMGGLVQDNPISTSTKVPFLGDIPGLGYAFRSETKSVVKDNLLIFITPTIVKDEDFRATDTQFFKSLPVKRPEMINNNNLWQGSHAYDWSNPTNTDPAQSIIEEPSAQ